MELTIEQALQQGVTAHKAGKLQEAEKIYRAILQANPVHPDANHNLGILLVHNSFELYLSHQLCKKCKHIYFLVGNEG